MSIAVQSLVIFKSRKKTFLPGGKKYVEWVTERGSKTRTGEQEFVSDRAFNPKMYTTGGPCCPVLIFKTYLSQESSEMIIPDHPFYLATIQNRVSEIWLKKQPLGKKKLSWFVHEEYEHSCWDYWTPH